MASGAIVSNSASSQPQPELACACVPYAVRLYLPWLHYQVRSRGRGAQDAAYKMRRVASFLHLRPHKTLECNV